MRLTVVIMRTLLNIPYGIRRITGTGAFGRRGARYLDVPPAADGNTLKAALWAHHVKQFNASSCSVAAVAAVINAIRSVRGDTGPPVIQREILERVDAVNWKARMSPEGHHGRRGLPLPLLGIAVAKSLETFDLNVQSVQTVQAVKRPQTARRIKAVLRQRLLDFDHSGTGLVIAHFDQGAYVPELNIPHISPVGAYDARADQVTMMDVDPDQERPYRVSFDTFYQGLSSDYHRVFQPFGYLSGGYVYVRLED